MAVEVGPVISFLSQRIVVAPSQVEAPAPTARGTPVKRFREGLILEAQFRQELTDLGWTAPDIDRTLVQARLEREFDDFTDRLNTLEEAFTKDLITFAEFKFQVGGLIVDPAKARLVVELADFKKRPKPKPLAPEEPPTLTVGRLLAAFKAGVLLEPGLRSELALRGYGPTDIDIMIATETARLPKPKAAARKQLSLADLRALLATGAISGEEFVADLVDRKYSPEDAQALLSLEVARQLSRLPTPKPETFRELPMGDVKALFLSGIITEEELRAELEARQFSPEDIDLEVSLLLAKLGVAPTPAVPGG